jgi:hypothetical protein
VTLPVVTVAQADAYFLTTPRSAAWAAVADQQIQLNEANRWLGALCFDQTRDCCGRVFADAYTEAISELALALSANATAIIGAAGTGDKIKRAQLGSLSVEYSDAGASTTSRYGPRAPYVLQRFPWLGDVLGCWLNVPTGSSRIIARVRS